MTPAPCKNNVMHVHTMMTNFFCLLQHIARTWAAMSSEMLLQHYQKLEAAEEVHKVGSRLMHIPSILVTLMCSC